MGSKPFTKQLRESTKKIHDVSDALVNLKLGVSMSDSSVWAEGLLVFYEIFRFLELDFESENSLIGELYLGPEMLRTSKFESDLRVFYGNDGIWTRDTYEIRPSVSAYLNRLRMLRDRDPYLLIAYYYHLYMGLFSGGQILAAKMTQSKGTSAVTDFGNRKISILKFRMKDAVNRIADQLDSETRSRILEEGSIVFKMNNEVIRSIKGVDDIFYRRMIRFFGYFFICVLIILYLFRPFG